MCIRDSHSTYASVIFQKIMSDILPYLNIFPDTDIQVDQEAAEKLPESEGITDMTGTETQEEPEESKVYDTEEYVDPGMDLGLPDAEASEGDLSLIHIYCAVADIRKLCAGGCASVFNRGG